MIRIEKKQFLVIKFEGFLVPLYIKLHPMHLANDLSVSYDEDTKEYHLKFVTGLFDYAKNDMFFVAVKRDERYGQDHVTMVCPDANLEWFRFECLYERDKDVEWSRKYFKEVYGIKYEKEDY